MTRIGAVAAVGGIKRGHAIEILIDRLVHLAAQDGADRLAAKSMCPFKND